MQWEDNIEALAQLLEEQHTQLAELNALLEDERAALLCQPAISLLRLEQLREAKSATLAQLERSEQARRELLRALDYPRGDRIDTADCATLFGLEPQWQRLLAELERSRRLNAQLAGLVKELTDFNAHRLVWAQHQRADALLYNARGQRSTLPYPAR